MCYFRCAERMSPKHDRARALRRCKFDPGLNISDAVRKQLERGTGQSDRRWITAARRCDVAVSCRGRQKNVERLCFGKIQQVVVEVGVKIPAKPLRVDERGQIVLIGGGVEYRWVRPSFC